MVPIIMSPSMKRLGVRYDLRSAPSERSPRAAGTNDPRPLYEPLLEHAARAEALGVGVLWVAERPFVRNARLPAAFPLCAALAERTVRARIATGVLPLPLHHPLRVAEDAATLDVISGGRFELGVGLGEHAEGFEGFGIPIRDRADRFEEALTLVRLAWTEDPVRFAGSHFAVADLAVYPRPVQRPHPPLWIAAGADTAVRRAARLGTGLLTDSLEAALRFLEAWEAEGHPRGHARIAWHVATGAGDPEAALPAVRAGLDRLSGAAVELVIPALPDGEASWDEGLRGLEAWIRALRPSLA